MRNYKIGKTGMKSNSLTLALFSFTLFLSAALMFGLQPMIGKMLLPIVGGTPAGWIVAMAFFQVMLLAGYFLAHLLSTFTPRAQGLLYLACMGTGFFFLPVSLGAHANLISETPKALDTFILLTATVAVPFAALSATASTLQRLFTTTGHAAAKDPYFLYAASNLGSFAGLLLYPFLVEPNTRLSVQSHGWLWGYAGLIFMAAICLLQARPAPAAKKASAAAQPVTWAARGEWLLLAFFPASLMMAVTTHITVNVFSAPMVWVLPLGLYLITFVIAFGRRKIVSYDTVLGLQPIAAAVALVLVYAITSQVRTSTLSMFWQLFAFTIIALMCHMRLAAKRPPDSRLTEFYFMMSLGGALGGVLNAFIIPVLFNRLLEYPLMLACASLLHPAFKNKLSRGQLKLLILCIAGFAAYTVFASSIADRAHVKGDNLTYVCDVIAGLLMLFLCFQPRLVFYGSILLIVIAELILPGRVPVLLRNFYGVVKVFDTPYQIGDKTYMTRFMYHGTTTHGFQILDPKFTHIPPSYYTTKGPVGGALLAYKPRKIGIIGLGTGTLSCYSTPKNEMTYFEIDPDVVKVAQENFTFMSACGTGAPPRIILGDARLEIARRPDEKFDMIILDAFSSDNIPTHLLTAEAIQLYMQHLRGDGLLLFHISNRYFNLSNPVITTARSLGLKTRYISFKAGNDPIAVSNVWVAIAKKDSSMKALKAMNWVDMDPTKVLRPWTDDYTNLLSTLRF